MHTSNYFYLFALAVILLSTNVFGTASRRISLPTAVGSLGAGIILGPSVMGVVNETDFLIKTGEIGVIILMFRSGLETDIGQLRANGKAALVTAVMGVIMPLAGGTLLCLAAKPEEAFIKALFTGVTLTATSVSITAETLREAGKLKTPVGTAILGAAIIDDIIGIVVLTAITGMSGEESVSVVMVLIKILLFFIFVFIIGLMAIIGKMIAERVRRRRRIAVYALAFCFAMSFCAEEFFGVADITGAYFAGIVLCSFGISSYIDDSIDSLGYLFFTPIFFACIGIRTDLRALGNEPSVIAFALILLAVAVATKIIGCGASAYLCGFNKREAVSIGLGMVSRGEVALIVAQKGLDSGLLDTSLFPAVVFMVIVTTLITPVLLKITLSKKWSV